MGRSMPALTGARFVATVTYGVDATVDSATVHNSGSARSDETSEPASGGASVSIVEDVQLSAVKAFADETVTAGDGLAHTFTVKVTNSGASDADDLRGRHHERGGVAPGLLAGLAHRLDPLADDVGRGERHVVLVGVSRRQARRPFGAEPADDDGRVRLLRRLRQRRRVLHLVVLPFERERLARGRRPQPLDDLDLLLQALEADAERLAERMSASELTVRELEVLQEIVKGKTNKEIASSLRISEATVKTHVGHVLTKLGLRDRVQAVVLAYEVGLVVPGGP